MFSGNRISGGDLYVGGLLENTCYSDTHKEGEGRPGQRESFSVDRVAKEPSIDL